MEKVLEALSKLLPEDQVKDVASALQDILDEAKQEMEDEYTSNLEDAYSKHTEELKSTETVAYEGYQQAQAIILDLRNRLDVQKEEYEHQIEQEYEEALKQIHDEQGKNNNIEVEMMEEYEKKLEEMRDYIVEKVDQFLKLKGSEIYEQARRDVMTDPGMAEHKVALEKILEVAQNYISEEDFAFATSSKLDEAVNEVEKLKGQVKVLEAKSIRLVGQKEKLEEQVRQAKELLVEQTHHAEEEDKKARIEKAAKASGRGKRVSEEVIAEYSNPAAGAKNEILEEVAEEYRDLNVLAGILSND